MSFPATVKEEALVKSRRCCCICHTFTGLNNNVHHIIQEADGGANTLDNAIVLCLPCHGNVGHYNVRHPIGNKYSPTELRKHRDLWWTWCEENPTANVATYRKPAEIIIEQESDYRFGVNTGTVVMGIPRGTNFIEFDIRIKNLGDEEAELQKVTLSTISVGTSLFTDQRQKVSLLQKQVYHSPIQFPLLLPSNTWNMRVKCRIALGYILHPKNDLELSHFAQQVGQMSNWAFALSYHYEAATGNMGQNELQVAGNYEKFKDGIYQHWRNSKRDDLIERARGH